MDHQNSITSYEMAPEEVGFPRMPESLLLRGILESISDMVVAVDREGRFLAFNRPYAEMVRQNTDYTVTVGGDLRSSLALLQQNSPSLLHCWERALTGEEFTCQVSLVTRDGVQRHYEGTFRRLSNAEDSFLGTVAVIRETTEQVQTRQALVQSEARLIEAQSVAQIGSWEADLLSGHVYWSEEMFHLLGFDPADGLPAYERLAARLHPDDRPLHAAMERKARESGEPRDFDIRVCSSENRYRWLHIIGRSIKDSSGKIIKTLGTVMDITERKQAEAELRASDQRYHLLMSAMKDVVSLFDMQAICLYISPSVYEQTGYTQAEYFGMSGFYWIHPEDRERCLHDAYHKNLRGENTVITWRLIRKDGSVILVETYTTVCKDAAGNPEYLLCVTRDITERQRLEEQIHQMQKMEGIGRLAGGIAHDFNNLLSVILGYAELLEEELVEDSALRARVHAISEASTRAANLTRQLLAFARRQPMEPKSVLLNELIEKLLLMLKPLIGEDISLEARLHADVGSIRMDPTQLEQILVNLVINARDAMPQGGVLRIETQPIDLDQERSDAHFEMQAGRYFLLAVADTGIGMSDAVKARLFEPFFTTKEVGQGTGLGLATVYGIVKQNNGYIFVESEAGQGTTFSIYLPHVEGSASAAEEMLTGISGKEGAETILLVEDESVLRDLSGLTLRQKGYVVLQAQNGREALQLAEAYPGEIDLLLTDVVMPEMGGSELAERIRRQRPNIRILLTSGYTRDRFDESKTGSAEWPLLPKPYTPGALLTKIREALNRASRTAS